MAEQAPVSLADVLRAAGTPILIGAEEDVWPERVRRVPLERDGLVFGAARSVGPAALLSIKQALQHQIDSARRRCELTRMSELFGDRLVGLLQALGRQQLDETGLARMFDFLGPTTRLAVRREGTLLFNRGLDPHTLRIGERRVQAVRVHCSAVGQGELFTCRGDAYEGYFLRDEPFTMLERALVELHLSLLSRHLRQQTLHQSIARLNEMFTSEFLPPDTPSAEWSAASGVATAPAPLDEFNFRSAAPAPSTTGGAVLPAADQVEQLFTRLLEAALKDSLTHAYNRHKTGDLLTQLCRTQSPFAIILLDIDHFKQVNDVHGHLTGDRILVEVVQRTQAAIRAEDVLARWGGEEFLIIARAFDETAAKGLAERVRLSIAERPMADGVHITASLGVTACQPQDTPKTILKRADRALYAAKRQGRDRVCLA